MMYEDLLGNPIRIGDKVIALIRRGPLAAKDEPIEGWWQTTVKELRPDDRERVMVQDLLEPKVDWVSRQDSRHVGKFPHNLVVVDKEWTDEAIELHVKILFGDIPKH